MNINLLINLYVDNNPHRYREIAYVFARNLNNPLISKIHAFVNDHQDLDILERYMPANSKLVYIPITARPTFNDYFSYTTELPASDLNIIANADILFDTSLEKAITFNWTNQVVFALTRWDYFPAGKYPDGTIIEQENDKYLDHKDSQDTWIFKGPIASIEDADFTLGVAGCDNKIPYLMSKQRYSVYNPSKEIKTLHVHNIKVLNYKDENNQPKQTIPSPYILLNPCTLEEASRGLAEKFYEHRP